MQPREKKLLMIVGGLLAVVLVFVGIRQVSNAYQQRADKQAELKDNLFAQEVQIRGGLEAKKKLAELESRSLAGDVNLSKSRYQNWLRASLDKAGLQGVDVEGRGRSRRTAGRISLISR